MAERGVTYDAVTYSLLLGAHALLADHTKIDMLMSEMREAGMEVTLKCHQEIIRAYAIGGHVQLAEEALQAAVRSGHAQPYLAMPLLKGCERAQDVAGVRRWLQRLPSLGMATTAAMWRLAIETAHEAGDAAAADALWRDARAAGAPSLYKAMRSTRTSQGRVVVVDRDTPALLQQPHNSALDLSDCTMAVAHVALREAARELRKMAPPATRLAPLSQGRVDESGNIECPYHGWSFTAQGGCVKMPHAEPTLRYPARSCATAYLVVHQQLPYDYTTMLENALDPAHADFTHHGSLSSRDRAKPHPCTLDKAGTLHINGFDGAVGPVRRIQFIAPFTVHSSFKLPGMESYFTLYAVPLEPGRARVIQVGQSKTDGFLAQIKRARLQRGLSGVVLSPLLNLPKPLWWTHAQGSGILEEDLPILNVQEKRLAAQGGWSNSATRKAYCTPMGTDLFVTQFYKWWDRFAAGGPWASTAAAAEAWSAVAKQPPLPMDKLLDRYTAHTSICAVCSGALRGVRKARTALTVAAAAATTMAVLRIRPHAMAALACACATLAWKACGAIEMSLTRGKFPFKRHL
ncbi:hypothetical protein JKP88DRAFT_349123 [Tribonema minus]|uniref:Rieske domain-containing protein n=1 Tax=Tribonema minus TaxID=303371 RepID=A0A835YUJ1_9STRA|nr:hypothetical protein JKP88DRAFT_349123 [Tribonema minus]